MAIDVDGIVHIDGNDVDEFSNRTIVTPLNDNCNLFNQESLCSLSGDLKEYCSVNAAITNYPADKLNMPLEYPPECHLTNSSSKLPLLCVGSSEI